MPQVVVLHDEGTFEGSFFHEGEMYHAEPLSRLASDLPVHTHKTLAKYAHNGMVIYREADIVDRGSCGTSRTTCFPW